MTESIKEEIEIIEQRTYNQKVYGLSDGKKRYVVHGGHIHYKDAQGDFQNSDFHLRKVTGGWTMDKHNYNMFIPDYADEWFDFYNAYEGANHHIKMKPVANHVLGIENHLLKYVLYKDAFGEGIDLKASIKRSGILKEIIINENPNKDVSFDFEIILDEKSNDIREGLESKNIIDASFSNVDLTNKAFRFGDKKASYVKSANVWDSNTNEIKSEPVKLTLVKQDDKLYLRKTILKEFFDNAVFPVYTDHPTNYYSSTEDGAIYALSAVSWAAVRGAATGNGLDKVAASEKIVNSTVFSGDNYIYRSFYYFDTSGITGDITACDLKLYISSADANVVILGMKGTQADTLTTADYDAFSGSEYGYTTASASSYATISFNATGYGEIVKDGVSKICVRERTYDYLNATPPSRHRAYANFTESASNDPYLDITISPTSSIKKVSGIEYASIKKIGGVAIGSVKKIAGVE